MLKFDFTKTELDYYIENCGFTDEELKVIKLRRKGMTHLEIASELNYCEKTIKNRCHSIHAKINRLTKP